MIGNINIITYKEVFPLIKENKAWLGTGMGRWISGFIVPESYELYRTEARVDNDGNRIIATNSCLWLTNIDHGKRHQHLQLMTMDENIKFNKKMKGEAYQNYDNFDAIEVPFINAIPSDYDGIMGVPISFLDKYCPEQFEIVNANDYRTSESVPVKKHGLIKDKEARITTKEITENSVFVERERERERENNLCTNLHQTYYSHRELMDGISVENVPMPEYLSSSYFDMVARPTINNNKIYRRIFIKHKK